LADCQIPEKVSKSRDFNNKFYEGGDVAATVTEMSIKTACRLLGCANRTQLAVRLGTHPQTVDYWHRRRDGRLPRLWRDRIELILLREAKPAVPPP
jgi:hypothetical protein